MIRLTILLLLNLTCTLSATAKIHTVNNTPGTNRDFEDLVTAHASAFDGDTIHIEGSTNSYGSLTITKRLVIIGPGYFLDENPDTPVSTSAIVANFTLSRTNQNDPFSGASGTEILGLSFTQLSSSGVTVQVSDTKIYKCEINSNVYISGEDVSGTTVIQNYFHGDGLDHLSSNTGLNSINFSNNIVSTPFIIADNSTGNILHNLFLGGSFNAEAFSGGIRSNIFTSTNEQNFEISATGNDMISHNTLANGKLGVSNDNNVASPNSLFLGENNGSTDGQYQLLSTASAVLNNAHDGTNRGPFGGNLPYNLSGLGSIPVINTIKLPASITAGQSFEVTIRATSGN